MLTSPSATPAPGGSPELDPHALQHVLASLPDTAVLVLAPDPPRFTILYATDEYLAATMKNRDGIVGRPLFEGLPENNPANPAPSGIQNLRASLESVVRDSRPHRMATQRYDIASADGSWQERYWAPHNVPVQGADGQVQAIIHHVRDVTAEVSSGNAAHKARQLASSTLERMADAYLLLDRESRILAVNAATEALLGIARDEMNGRHPAQVAPPWFVEAIGSAQRRVLVEGVELHVSGQCAAANPDHHLEIDAYPTEEAGVVVFLRDVTARVHAEAELREASHRKDVFIATLAHELRNPLAPIRTGLRILRLAPAGSPAATKALDVMERQLSHTVHLLDDLLDVSRISRGKVHLRLEPITLGSLLDQAVEAGLPFADAGGHRLVSHVRDAAASVMGDRTRLLQVISNLVNNAAKYTPAGGTIRLSAWVQDGRAIIEVADDGVGIPPDKLATVFELFTQLSGGNAAQNGLGIGLSLSKTLMELHGGTLEAASAGIGQGSTFTARLPLMAQDAPHG